MLWIINNFQDIICRLHPPGTAACMSHCQQTGPLPLALVGYTLTMTPAHTVTLTSAFDHCSENNYF